MATNKLWFAGIAQNNGVAFRFFDSETTVKKVAEKHPDKIFADLANVGCMPIEQVNLDNLGIITSVEQFEAAPSELGQNNTETAQSTQNAEGTGTGTMSASSGGGGHSV